MDIKYFDRRSGNYNSELVYNVGSMKFLFDNSIGKFFTNILFSKYPFSQFYGSFKDSSHSLSEVPEFIEKYQIDMDDFEECDYGCFNDFFIRKFRPGVRTFNRHQKVIHAPCEGRYLAYEKNLALNSFPVKGVHTSAKDLLLSNKWSNTFHEGPIVICRLAPVDYHRFHFPVEGELLDQYDIDGSLYSVNPICLNNQPDVFLRNHRRVSILKSKDYGEIAYIEVGAFCVGKIIQTHQDKKFNPGDEKGYFLFGGSTVILLGEKGRWAPDTDICEQTSKGFETFIRLGEGIAR